MKLAAVWNRTANKAYALARGRDLEVYEDLNDMLGDPQVRFVHVATTPARHAEHTLAALAHGKHVFCEKPIATKLADAQAVVREADRRGLRLGVNFVMRYGPLVLPFKEVIDSQVLGAPLRGIFTNRAGVGGLPEEHWFWDEAESGGIFVEHGVHFFGERSVKYILRVVLG